MTAVPLTDTAGDKDVRERFAGGSRGNDGRSGGLMGSPVLVGVIPTQNTNCLIQHEPVDIER